MALSDNKIIRKKTPPFITKLKITSGAITIYKGAHLQYVAGDIGYVQLAADTALGVAYSAEYAGIALENKTLAAADNVTKGDNEVEVLTRGCGEIVEMDVTSNITIANEGDPVYVDTDEKVDISSGVANTVTNGFVGIIRQFISTNKAWVQMAQSVAL